MKAEFDKEIDSLLRQSARRGRAVSGAPPVAAAHLDADEQSAYVENALPAAARAHYAAHLADCDDCRRSVTQLALAAGMPAQLEPRDTATGQEVSTGINWRERLGALFAPRALRYVAPALALLLVGAVSFIVLTRKAREEAATVARRNTSETKPVPATQTEAHHAPQNYNAAAEATPVGESAAVAPGADASAPREEIAVNRPQAEVAAPVTVAPLNNDAPPRAAPASGSGVGARTVSELPTPAPTPAAVATDVVTITSDEGAKGKSGESNANLLKLERRAGNVENRQYENRQREPISGPYRGNNEQARNARTGNTRDAQNRADEKDRATAATTAPAPPTAAAAAKRSTRREAEDLERGESAPAKLVETRTVAGRKFRRQGDAWVDAAFNAGQSYTTVRRNSEQFRALVADEPELRRIAGALGGDVTVVWKGRAYRIR